jgi:hypothetical protein
LLGDIERQCQTQIQRMQSPMAQPPMRGNGRDGSTVTEDARE